MTELQQRLAATIRDIADFPKPGIIFKDITPILQDAGLFKAVVDAICDRWADDRPDAIAAVDARGFIFGGAVAYQLGCGFIPLRKKGKLPWETVTESYTLEYGSNTIEMHADAVKPGERVLLVDDLLATGGTAVASVKLLRRRGAVVSGFEFLVELCFLNGRARLQDVPVYSLLQVED